MIGESVKLRKRKCSEKLGPEKSGSEKPYSCPNCQKMFSDKRGLKPHLKKCNLSMAIGEIHIIIYN